MSSKNLGDPSKLKSAPKSCGQVCALRSPQLKPLSYHLFTFAREHLGLYHEI